MFPFPCTSDLDNEEKTKKINSDANSTGLNLHRFNKRYNSKQEISNGREIST